MKQQSEHMSYIPEGYPNDNGPERGPGLEEMAEMVKQTHDALQLSYADPNRPASLTEQRAVFLGIVNTALRDRHYAVDHKLTLAVAEVVDYLWYRSIDSARLSAALSIESSDGEYGEVEGEIMFSEELEDELAEGGLERTLTALEVYGFDSLRSMRERNYALQQGTWQRLLHEQITASSGARWLRQFCVGATTDTRLSRKEYASREAMMRGQVAHLAVQSFGYMDPSAYYRPATSRLFRRIPFDLEDERGSRQVRESVAIRPAQQLEGLREEIFSLLAQGRDVQGVSYDTEGITLYSSTGRARTYSMSEAVAQLLQRLGETNHYALNSNSIDVLARVTGILFSGDPLNGQPYHAIVGDTFARTLHGIEEGFRLSSPTQILRALNAVKRPNPYIKADDADTEKLDLPTNDDLPDMTSSEVATRDSPRSLLDELERQLMTHERPPLLDIVNLSYDRLLDEARTLLLLDREMPEDTVFAAMQKSHMRQGDLLVRALGTTLSLKRELESGMKEPTPSAIQDFLTVWSYLDKLPPMPKHAASLDDVTRTVALVMSALKPLSSYLVSEGKV